MVGLTQGSSDTICPDTDTVTVAGRVTAGTGQLQSKATVCHEIVRQIRREKDSLPGYKVVVNAHPAICDMLKPRALTR